jgi:hypothetical protein
MGFVKSAQFDDHSTLAQKAITTSVQPDGANEMVLGYIKARPEFR